MKTSIIIVLLFLSAFAKAQWYEGSVLYIDGSIEKGYIKYFEDARTRDVNLKSVPEEKSKKIKSEHLKEIRFINDKGENITYLRLLPTSHYTNIKNFYMDHHMTWFSLYYRGEFDVVCQESNILNYYIHMQGNDSAIHIHMVSKGWYFRNQFRKHAEQFFQEAAKVIFKYKCSTMSKDIQDKTFLPLTIDELIEYYEKNCATITTCL